MTVTRKAQKRMLLYLRSRTERKFILCNRRKSETVTGQSRRVKKSSHSTHKRPLLFTEMYIAFRPAGRCLAFCLGNVCSAWTVPTLLQPCAPRAAIGPQCKWCILADVLKVRTRLDLGPTPSVHPCSWVSVPHVTSLWSWQICGDFEGTVGSF